MRIHSALDDIFIQSAMGREMEDLPPEIHRGFSARLNDERHALVHNFDGVPAEQAQALMDHYREWHQRNNKGKENLGRHWSTDPAVAASFARASDPAKWKNGYPDPYDFDSQDPRSTKLVFHAQTPGNDAMIRGDRVLKEHDIFPAWHGEKEVPVKSGRKLKINGISWGNGTNGMRRYDFPEPLDMKA
jgi:hypothetical protein